MSDIVRYDLSDTSLSYEPLMEMVPVEGGDWVRAEDYDALSDRLAAAERRAEEAEKTSERYLTERDEWQARHEKVAEEARLALLEADRERAQAAAMAQRLLPQIDAERLARLVQLFLCEHWLAEEHAACIALTGDAILTREHLRREAGRVLTAAEANRCG